MVWFLVLVCSQILVRVSRQVEGANKFWANEQSIFFAMYPIAQKLIWVSSLYGVVNQ